MRQCAPEKPQTRPHRAVSFFLSFISLFALSLARLNVLLFSHHHALQAGFRLPSDVKGSHQGKPDGKQRSGGGQKHAVPGRASARTLPSRAALHTCVVGAAGAQLLVRATQVVPADTVKFGTASRSYLMGKAGKELWCVNT